MISPRAIPFLAQPILALDYKGTRLRQGYPRLNLLRQCHRRTQGLGDLTAEHRAQVLNYLKATGHHLGLLVNFGGAAKARIERLAL